MQTRTLSLTLSLLFLALPAHAIGPGLGNVSWSAEQVFAPVGFIESPDGHGNVTMVQGYLMVLTSSDGGGHGDGGIEFWDVSNPAAPALVARHDDVDTNGLREAHGFSLSWLGERLVLAAQGVEGVTFWDVTDAPAIERLSYLDLPGIAQGDYTGDWWLFWQAPWLYVAGVDSGLAIVDATDPSAPVLSRVLTTGELAGVSPSQAFALGNLLVLMESQSRAFVTLDISRPNAPRVVRRLDGKPGYSHIFAGDGKIYTSGNIPPRVSVHQVSPAGDISFVESFTLYFNSGGYGSYQDGVFHSGFSDRYVKTDVVTGEELGTGTSGREDRDEDFATVLGNVVFAGDDHGEGTALIAHQAGPDLTAPVVEWMHPPAGATDLALTSRVGLSFSDHIDAASLTDDTLFLEDDVGARVPLRRSTQMGLVNLSPDTPLLPERTYRVVAEGVRDLAGNASARFEATIVTGDGSSVGVIEPGTVVPSVDSNGLFGAYTTGSFSTGAPTYVDRDFAFAAGYPERLEGQPYIQTRNNDKLGVRADALTFELASAAEVLVLYDVRADAPPDWLSAFAPTGEVVANDDTSYDVYTRAFEPGTVTLGGNSAAGSAGTESMYSVVIVTAPFQCAVTPSPAPVGLVSFAATGPAGASYDWQIGDAVLANAGATPTLTLPAGRHSVVVTVTNGARIATCSAVQIVHRPLLPASERARSSTSMVWLGDRVITVNADNGTVTAVDAGPAATASAPTLAWETATGTEPISLALTPTADLWVLDREDARISVLDATTGAVASTISLPRASRPEALVIDANGDAFVALGALGDVVRLDASGTVVARAFVTPTARGLTLHDGALYVSRFLSPATHGEIVVVDAATLATTRTIELSIDLGPDTEATGRGVLNQLSPMRVSADGTRGFVGATKANVERGLFLDARPLTFESRVRAVVATIDLTTGTEILEERRDINDRDGVQANLTSTLGDVVFVAARGGNMLDVFETASGRRVSQMAVGKGPQELALDGTRLAVQNALGRTVSIFDAAALIAGTGNAVFPRGDVVTVASERLAPEVLRGKRLFYDASDRRIAKDGYIACASCHLDGGHDGRTWDFTQAGEGLRNTISLQGRAGTGHGRVHWTANFDEIQDFENDIRNAFGGTGLLSDEQFASTSDPLGAPKAGLSEDLDALAAYVTSLREVPASPHRDDGKLTAAARRGRAVFVAAECAACHAGATFSDGARHDVGTITEASGLGIHVALTGVGFDTPTLKGVWDTAPFFHDGSAATLDDVLARHVPGVGLPAIADATGADLVLDDDARVDLLAYLAQLDESAGAPEDDCALHDECIVPDDGEGGEPGDPNDPNGPCDDVTPPGARGCGCSSASPSDLGILAIALALALLVRVRTRRRSR